MKILKENFEKLPQTIIALGKFDAIHNGHKKILNEVNKISKEKNIKSLVFSFEIMKDNLIITKNEKIKILEEQKMDFLYFQAFTDEFKNMSARDFFIKILIEKCNAKHIVAGDDWHFGKNREGDVNLLKKLCEEKDIGISIIERLKTFDTYISSSKIREYVSNGDIKNANKMLGRNFAISGLVVSGKHLGTKMGFPTVNLKYDNEKILPSKGVYKTRVLYENVYYQAMTNVGINPTVDKENLIRIETHIFDFDKEIYGDFITVEFLDKIRDEIKFSSVDELISQLEKDKLYAKGKNWKIFKKVIYFLKKLWYNLIAVNLSQGFWTHQPLLCDMAF